MATGITTYQCPACMGPLRFVGESGKLECEYCGSVYEVSQIEARQAAQEQASVAAQAKAEAAEAAAARESGEGGWSAEESEALRAYNCPSCGAELLCDATTAATSCPYCGNPAVVPSQLAGSLRPDYVLPFRLSREDAIRALGAYYKGKKLLPREFREQNHMEKIQGVYVPFWLYSGTAQGRATYLAETVRSWREGDYRITETRHFRVERGGSMDFERIPVDSSTKMPDNHMDAIEPFDYSALRPFSMAYLPGFLADKYDVSETQAAARMEERAKNSTLAALEETVVGYAAAHCTGSDCRISRDKAAYALLPVWLLSTSWKGKNFLFAMNGQTGKLIGDLPVSAGRYWAWFAGVAAAVLALSWGLWFGFFM